MKPIKAWWFSKDMKLPHGDGRRIQRGRTLVHKGELELCKSGLHASVKPLDALQFAPGSLCHRVECSGEIIQSHNKLVCTRRKHLEVFPAEVVLRKYALLCALSVAHMWEIPEVTLRYLKTGDEKIRAAAQNAAWVAVQTAAWDYAQDAARIVAWIVIDVTERDTALDAADATVRIAAQIAAWDAAWATTDVATQNFTRDAQNKRLSRMLLKALKEQRQWPTPQNE